MRVCLITLTFPPLGIGGISTQSYDLAFNLSRAGIDVHVLTAGVKQEENYVEDIFKITRLKMPQCSKLMKTPIFQFKVWQWLRKNDAMFDIIHFQETVGFLYFLSYGCKKRCNITIEHFHHSHISEFMFHLKFLLKIPIESIPYLFIPLSAFEEFICLKKAKNVITVSNMSRSVLRSSGIDSTKIAVIPNAISELSFTEKRKLHQDDIIKLLYVGRLVPRKGVDILIEALDILKKKGIEGFQVDIIGQGPLFKYCTKKIKENDLTNCKMWGFVPQQKLSELYIEADCFICPSRLEGFGIVLLEAAASGLAIIANDIPVFKEIYSNDEVLYFKRDASEDLAQKIKDLCSNPEKIRFLQERAREEIKNYSWDVMVNKYIEVYKNLLNINNP